MSIGSSASGLSPAAQSRRGRRRKVLRSVASAALVAAIFGLALPHFASYRSVWASMRGDDLAICPACRSSGRREHGLVLVPDLRGAAVGTAARGGGRQPRLQRGGEHAARRRCAGHGSQLGDAVQLGCQHGRQRPLHPGVGHLECLRPPGPAGPRAAGPADGPQARYRPDRRRGRGPGLSRRRGGGARPAAAQRGLRAARWSAGAAHGRGCLPSGPAAAALRCRRGAVRLPRPGPRPGRRTGVADHRRDGGQPPPACGWCCWRACAPLACPRPRCPGRPHWRRSRSSGC